MCQEIIPRINGSHKKTKPCRTHAVHAVKWKITKLFIRNINLAAINWSVDPLTSIYLYLICVYQIRMQRGKKKSKMESVTFDSTASSIQIKALVSTAGRQTAISLQQHLPNKTSVLSADLSFWILTPKECISWAISESSKNAITIIKV